MSHIRRKHNKDDEFAPATHIVFALEHEAHRSEVVENNRNDKRDRGTDEVGNAEYLGKEDHHTVIDNKCDDANDTEFHELGDELLQANSFICLHKKKGPAKQSLFIHGAPNGTRTRVSALKGPRPNR